MREDEREEGQRTEGQKETKVEVESTLDGRGKFKLFMPKNDIPEEEEDPILVENIRILLHVIFGPADDNENQIPANNEDQIQEEHVHPPVDYANQIIPGEVNLIQEENPVQEENPIQEENVNQNPVETTRTL